VASEISEIPTSISWQPQTGPQEALIDCPYSEILFGGARGGGKTDGVLGKFGLKEKRYGRAMNAVFFRREMPQQDDLIERAKELYLPTGAEWHEQKKLFKLAHGGRVRFRPLENISDAAKYQGQNLTDAAIEEAGDYPDSSPIDRLFGSLRSVEGVPVQLILTANPGGPGHGWLKERYINPAPLGWATLVRKLPTGKEHKYIYIPSRVENNKLLMAKDPGYIDRLHLTGSAELVRAWVSGDWEIHEGSYFPEFSIRHIVAPFEIPKHWPKYVGFDWGYHSPFCVVWGAVSSGKDDQGREVAYPKNAIIIYREWTGKGLDNEEIAKGIRERSEGEDWVKAVADPSIFKHDGGASIGDQLRENGVVFQPADNERVSGWTQIRLRLKRNPAYIYFFATCKYLISSLPALPIDLKKPEDLDSTADDHGADALRYLCKERMLESEYKEPKQDSKMGRIYIADYIKRKRDEQQRPRL
jgi:hypothetical protein